MLAHSETSDLSKCLSRQTHKYIDILADSAIGVGFDDAPDCRAWVQLLDRHICSWSQGLGLLVSPSAATFDSLPGIQKLCSRSK